MTTTLYFVPMTRSSRPRWVMEEIGSYSKRMLARPAAKRARGH